MLYIPVHFANGGGSFVTVAVNLDCFVAYEDCKRSRTCKFVLVTRKLSLSSTRPIHYSDTLT